MSSDALCIGLLSVANIRYFADLYYNFRIYVFLFTKYLFPLLLKLSIAGHADHGLSQFADDGSLPQLHQLHFRPLTLNRYYVCAFVQLSRVHRFYCAFAKVRFALL